LYAELCRRFADDPSVAAIVGNDPSWDAPLRLLGGMHYLVLGGEATWDDPPAAHAEFLREFVRTQGVQTNEVQRSWVLLPCFLRAAELLGADELDVVELGPSAGLNLVWDRYHYVYDEAVWGPDDAPLTLSGEQRTPLPAELLARVPRVVRRVGIDRAPIDVTTDEGSRLLQCFVWAGQDERLARLRQAIEAVRADPPELVRGDLAQELPRVLRDVPTIVFQTAVFGYLDDATVLTVKSTLSEPGRPLAFVTAGGGRTGEHVWGMRIFRPGHEREYLGEADYHGAWLRYSL